MVTVDLMRALARVSRAQHGLLLRRQVLDSGVSAAALGRLVRSGHLEIVHPGVYRVAGSPATWEQRVLAAVLAAAPDAVASHTSAGVLWGLLEGRSGPVEITVPRQQGPRVSGAVVHRSRDLAPGHLTRRRAIPVTHPLRTMVDLGAVLPAQEVEDALDRGLEARLFSVAAVDSFRADVARPGRRGSGVLRRVIDGRALGTDRPDSLLEPRMARLLVRHGLPPAVFQHEARAGDGRFLGRIDFAYPERRLAIEVDGYEKRSTPGAMQRDHDRQNDLVADGWTVLRFTWHDVVRRPQRVARRIGEVLGPEG